jgi:hypothetical protein
MSAVDTIVHAVFALLGEVVDRRLAQLAPDEVLGFTSTRLSRALPDFDRRYALAVAERAPHVAAEHAAAVTAHERYREHRIRQLYLATLKRGVYGVREHVAELQRLLAAQAKLGPAGDPPEGLATLASLHRWAKRQLAKLEAAPTPNPYAVVYALLLLDSVVEWERDQLDPDDEEQLLGPAVLAEMAQYQEYAAEGLDDGAFDGLPIDAPVGFAPEHAGKPAPHAPAYVEAA